jgi:hypothetical protein
MIYSDEINQIISGPTEYIHLGNKMNQGEETFLEPV